MNFRMDEDPFAKNSQGISKIHHEIFLLMQFLQTKPQVKEWILNITIYIILLLKKETKTKM